MSEDLKIIEAFDLTKNNVKNSIILILNFLGVLKLKKQIRKSFIIVILLLALALIFISEISSVAAVRPESYKPSQMPGSSLIDSNETIKGTNETIVSMKSRVTSLIFIIIITALIYFIPTVVCLIRKHTYKFYIISLNIILGWTLIGWIASLIWSFIDNKKTEK